MFMQLLPRSTVLALLCVLTASRLAPARALACSTTWVAPVDGNWNDPTRWSGAAVPSGSDDVCITVDGTYTVTLNGSANAASVTVGAVRCADSPGSKQPAVTQPSS